MANATQSTAVLLTLAVALAVAASASAQSSVEHNEALAECLLAFYARAELQDEVAVFEGSRRHLRIHARSVRALGSTCAWGICGHRGLKHKCYFLKPMQEWRNAPWRDHFRITSVKRFRRKQPNEISPPKAAPRFLMASASAKVMPGEESDDASPESPSNGHRRPPPSRPSTGMANEQRLATQPAISSEPTAATALPSTPDPLMQQSDLIEGREIPEPALTTMPPPPEGWETVPTTMRPHVNIEEDYDDEQGYQASTTKEPAAATSQEGLIKAEISTAARPRVQIAPLSPSPKAQTTTVAAEGGVAERFGGVVPFILMISAPVLLMLNVIQLWICLKRRQNSQSPAAAAAEDLAVEMQPMNARCA